MARDDSEDYDDDDLTEDDDDDEREGPEIGVTIEIAPVVSSKDTRAVVAPHLDDE